ncbi:hypothetical protein [Variovorax ginsengisoli]|uniref:Uncharacterized protein n=1 Tax=Variovorax ginsengisoli TaxID=363844 RepID=A0ABT8SIW7_9BURK|nr:hypothetical protein [Variovorax ginsengisoli]MDN8618316.1 hypothetical protein [Variovorax ginsengisoli]MDO1537486.1 hypothetical protein [Variovorax ginsengisoli]
MSQNDDTLDFRIRFHRDESPMLFRAFAGLEAAPGMRKRNMFARQLMEMGLIVMEERMRRQDGLSTRVSSGLADELSASAVTMARPTGLPAAAPPALPESPPESGTDRAVSAAPASAPAEAAPPAPAPAPVPAPQIAAVTAPVAANIAPADDDRPPPRLGGARAVRMLDGESLD